MHYKQVKRLPKEAINIHTNVWKKDEYYYKEMTNLWGEKCYLKWKHEED